MATSQQELSVPRGDSPPLEASPMPALGARPDFPRYASTASSSTDASFRDSLGSDVFSRHSSASYPSRVSDVSMASSRHSTGSFDKSVKRRGFSRPQATDFAASAKQRESVLSLGSIAHLQYYFARTGLLDGKGGQIARKRQPRATLDLSQLDTTSFLNPQGVGSDVDSSYASMGSSPDLGSHSIAGGAMVESPIDEHEGFDSDEWDDTDPNVLPPTTSTYNHREKHVPKPPTILELKAELNQTLDDAAHGLDQAAPSPGEVQIEIQPASDSPGRSKKSPQGWHEIQGMHILDVMTLAIRAAKLYYTAHEHPDRLDSIKSEREIRSELLSVMEVLKHMATRNFAGGLREDERQVMSSWIAGIRSMLTQEETIEASEASERANWTWLNGDWAGQEVEREIAFLKSMDPEMEALPAWSAVDTNGTVPTPFLEYFQNGLRLVKLHNAAVKKSQRRFGAIPTFHTDTQKPYRCAENLRYWIKAAELRWEVVLKVDVLGVVYNNNPEVWADFEAALWKWCAKVREEITTELNHQ